MTSNISSWDFERRPLRIGTRTSPLALRQTDIVVKALQKAWPALTIDIVKIKSAADWKKQDGERALNEQAGGKGQFAKEIETAHLQGKIDCGVHSAKDMPSFLPDGLHIRHYLPREDAADLFISDKYKIFADLPQGAVIGTCSPRRKAYSLNKRPDLTIVNFRGNIDTRLQKIKDGQVDASFLAAAGLVRLGLDIKEFERLPPQDCLPAAGQGAICIETAFTDHAVQHLFDKINCPRTSICVRAERTVLKILDGSCHTPIAVYATWENNVLSLNGRVWSLDGAACFEMTSHQKITALNDTAYCENILQKLAAEAHIFKQSIPVSVLKAITQ